TVHAIGFAVDEAARAQLSCLAEATGGSYTDAADGPALERTLPRVTTAALRSYQPTGTPVTGGPDHTSAPLLAPGHYLDTISQHEVKYYAVDIPQGATAYFTGIVTYPRNPKLSIITDMNSVRSRVYGRDGTDCGASSSEMAGESRDGQTAAVAEVWRGATREPRTGRRGEDTCRGGGRYYFALRWKLVSGGMPQTLPMEVLVGIEPEATDPGPEPDETPTAMAEQTGPAVPVVGGGSFAVAPELPGSGRYTDVLQRGETVFYRVRLDWGQGLAYRVRYDEADDPTRTERSSIRTELYSPWAEEIDSDGGGYSGSEPVLLPGDGPAATLPIRYTNRELRGSRAAQSVAGWYYIAVKLGPPYDEGPAQPATVTIEPGPAYATPVRDGVFGAPDETNPAATAADPAATAADHSSGPFPLPLLAALVGAVGLIAVLAAVLLAARRRGRR
ncbi:MAG TPA: hypothetical protein VK001_13140, partial [Geminicoccaceae bacterium]|nr:hypothetical protein [Geminicoccaceae bacterium]